MRSRSLVLHALLLGSLGCDGRPVGDASVDPLPIDLHDPPASGPAADADRLLAAPADCGQATYARFGPGERALLHETRASLRPGMLLKLVWTVGDPHIDDVSFTAAVPAEPMPGVQRLDLTPPAPTAIRNTTASCRCDLMDCGGGGASSSMWGTFPGGGWAELRSTGGGLLVSACIVEIWSGGLAVYSLHQQVVEQE